MADPVINWTPEKLKRFKAAHLRAGQELGPQGVFTFEGHEFLVSYAKYLIEFLDEKFKWINEE